MGNYVSKTASIHIMIYSCKLYRGKIVLLVASNIPTGHSDWTLSDGVFVKQAKHISAGYWKKNASIIKMPSKEQYDE